MTTTAPAAPEPLTPRQAEVFAYLYETTRDTGIQPGIREIMRAFGWTSPNAPRCHLRALEDKGWIEMADGKRRAMKLIRKPNGTKFRGFSDK